MKKIVIFGATGNIGVYFVDYCKRLLDDDEYSIIAVGRKLTSYFDNIGVEYINLDVCREEDFNKLPTENIYAIVNLVGVLPAYTSVYNPYSYVEVNILGSLRILEYARRTKTDRVIYTQTWADQAGYWNEQEVLSPSLPRKLKYTGDHALYAITKSMVVDSMEYYKQEYGIKNIIFRLPNVYMYHPQMTYFVDGVEKKVAYRYMIEQAIKGEPIEIWGNPDAFKDILYIKDLCQMMYKALFAQIDGGTYNAGTGIRTTLREQIVGIVEVFSPKDRKSEICEKPDGDTFTSFVMDIENIKQDLGYNPEYTYIKYLEDYKIEREEKRFNQLWGNS